MGYASPADVPVSWGSDYQGHKGRTPPSGEPGTDYETVYGTDLRMAGAGVVSVVDMSPNGAEGRRVSIDLDDGRRVSYIHLSRSSAYVGLRVGRGQRGVVWSGASGHGQDWYYGPHVHVSLWERPGMAYKDTIDFERYVDDDTPPPPVPVPPPVEEEDMPGVRIHHQVFTNGNQAYVVETTTGFYIPDSSYLAALSKAYEVDLDALPHLNEYDWNAVTAAKDKALAGYPQPGASSAAAVAPLVTPAWVTGVFLGLIGLVEVIRFVVDLGN